jgi:hypothetical protein
MQGEKHIKVRVLVALERDYHAYRDMITAGVHMLRPHVEVKTVDLEVLEMETKRVDPHLVICDRPNSVDSGSSLAWVELPMHPTRPMKVWIGGRCSERAAPTLEAILSVIDEVVGDEVEGLDRHGSTNGSY